MESKLFPRYQKEINNDTTYAINELDSPLHFVDHQITNMNKETSTRNIKYNDKDSTHLKQKMTNKVKGCRGRPPKNKNVIKLKPSKSDQEDDKTNDINKLDSPLHFGDDQITNMGKETSRNIKQSKSDQEEDKKLKQHDCSYLLKRCSFCLYNEDLFSNWIVSIVNPQQCGCSKYSKTDIAQLTISLDGSTVVKMVPKALKIEKVSRTIKKNLNIHPSFRKRKVSSPIKASFISERDSGNISLELSQSFCNTQSKSKKRKINQNDTGQELKRNGKKSRNVRIKQDISCNERENSHDDSDYHSEISSNSLVIVSKVERNKALRKFKENTNISSSKNEVSRTLIEECQNLDNCGSQSIKSDKISNLENIQLNVSCELD